MSIRLTRSQTGSTPRKPLNPGFVETPARKRQSRKSLYVDSDDDAFDRSRSGTAQPIGEDGLASSTGSLLSANGHSQEYANGHSNGEAKATRLNGVTSAPKEEAVTVVVEDYKVDKSPTFEFGGSLVVSLIMVGFPMVMYYAWIGATYYDGHFPLPAEGQSIQDFLLQLVNYVYVGAYPSAKAWAIYWVFFVVEGLFFLYLPGVTVKGKPLAHLGGQKLDYYCSAQWSWHATTVIALALHFSGLFPLQTIIDEFGPIMSVSILSGTLISIVAYISAIARGAQHRMTGHLIYDFFMGAELNPRLFGRLDFKMFFEVRIPWFILYLVSVATACKQYELYGYVTPEAAFLIMAHWLYANACSKGEELIPLCWDMYFEKWGFMLIFWNLAGVPFTYCHCALYLAHHHPSEYQWNPYVIGAYTIFYVFVYWVWDTANSQKNFFRAEEKGVALTRVAFPQLPYRSIKNPRKIESDCGDAILADGWFGKARKIHYSCDTFFAVSWGLITGFNSPFPWFYPIFFVLMITHRTWRDVSRCRQKYGESWKEYERTVPYLLIPYVI